MAMFVKFFPANGNAVKNLSEEFKEVRSPLAFAAAFLLTCIFTLLVFWDETAFVPLSYHSLSLGMDMDTVEYVIGKPSQVMAGNEVKDYSLEKQADKYFTAHRYKIWKYADGIVVSFNQNDKVIKVSCFGSADHHQCEPLYGLKIGDAEDMLVGKLGADYESKIEDGKKYIYYAALNGQFDLEKRKIVGLELSDFSDFMKK